MSNAERNLGADRSDKLGQIWVLLRDQSAPMCAPNTGGCSVGYLAKASGLSRPTVTTLVHELASLGLVAQTNGTSESQLGRPATAWKLSGSAGIIVAVDVLIDTALIVAITLAGEVIHASAVKLTKDVSQRIHDLAMLIKTTSDTHRDAGPLRQVTISTTGIIDDDGTILHSDLLPELDGIQLAVEIGNRVGAPVAVNNDINMAAYGEFCTRRDQGTIAPAGDLLYVQLARGIHTGLVMHGQIRRGQSYTAGEISDFVELEVDSGIEPDERWKKQVARTISSVGTVIDPDQIVVSTPDAKMTATIEAVIQDVRDAYAAKGVSGHYRRHQDIDIARLGWGASAVGAAYVGIEKATKTLLGVSLKSATKLRNIHLIHSVLRKGEHTTLSSVTETPETLRVGVVGCGARAPLALAAERPENGGIITAVCEPHPDAAKRVEAQLRRDPKTVTITEDVAGLIASGVDVAFVTSPDDTHADVTCELLEAGIPVYLEKPLAITLDSATAILETAFRTRTRLYVGHNMRHMNVVRTMRQIIKDGRIGEVKAIWCRHFVGSGGDFYFKDWHAERARGTGLLLQKAAHDIDVMHWLADAHTNEVVAMGDLTVYGQIQDRADHSNELMRDWYSLNNWPPLTQKGLNPTIDVEDLSMMLMRMDSGVLASYQQCHYTPDYWRNYTVIGTEGRIENFGDGAGGHIKLWNKRTHYNPDGDETFPIIGDADGHGDADVLTVTEFMRFVREGGSTDTNPLGAWYAVAAGIQATESLRDGSTPRKVEAPRTELIEYFNHNQQPLEG